MRIDIITALPGLIQAPFNHSILKKSIEKKLVEVHFHDLRDYAVNNYGKIDDAQFGGGAGMVLMIEPIDKCIKELSSKRTYDEVIYMTPDADILNQKTANTLSLKKNIIILCGHYKGIDHRVREHLITKEISIGDYVLSGGELATVVLCDALVRLIPGVLSDETSALSDSFQDDLLAAPVYTRPANYQGIKAPEILLSGDFPKIEKWRHDMAIKRTLEIKPKLLES